MQGSKYKKIFYYFVHRPNKVWPAIYVFSPSIPEILPAFLPLAGCYFKPYNDFWIFGVFFLT
jgi:hypothetical protein